MPADGIEIRAARPVDAGHIAAVQIRTWQNVYANIFPAEKLAELDQDHLVRTERWHAIITKADPMPALLVAQTQAGKIVGFAGGGRQNDPNYPYDSEIFVIYILPEYQNQGLGRRLMGAAAGELDRLGFKSMMLWVLAENQNSRRFYEALGGKLIGQDEYVRWDQTYSIAAYAWESLSALISS